MKEKEISKKLKMLNINDWKTLILFYKTDMNVTYCIKDVMLARNLSKIQARYVLEKLYKLKLINKFNSFIIFYTNVNDDELCLEIRKNYLILIKELLGDKNYEY